MNKELTRLHEAGLLDREQVGNQLQYSANRSHQIFPELSSILRKTVGMADVLLEALGPLSDAIDLAFIYGSVARGTESAASDVDLLIVGTAGFGRLTGALSGVEKKIGRELNAKLFSPKECKARRKSGDPFVAEISAGPKIMLIGALDEPRKPRRHKP
jgi:predicted nucleotidyltransferase